MKQAMELCLAVMAPLGALLVGQVECPVTTVVQKELSLPSGEEVKTFYYPVTLLEKEFMLFIHPDGGPLETYNGNGSMCKSACIAHMGNESKLILTRHTKPGVRVLYRSNLHGVILNVTLVVKVVQKELSLPAGEEVKTFYYPVTLLEKEFMLFINPDGGPLETYYNNESMCKSACVAHMGNESKLILTRHTKPGLRVLYRSNLRGVILNVTLVIKEVNTGKPKQPEVTSEQPVIPTEQPVIPTEQPVVLTEQLVFPTEQPVSVVPTEQPVVLTEQPVFPTEQPVSVVPTEQPVVPTEQPVVPTEHPVVPTEQPVAPTEQPEVPTEQSKIPTEQPKVPTEHPKVLTEQPTKVPTEQTKLTTGAICGIVFGLLFGLVLVALFIYKKGTAMLEYIRRVRGTCTKEDSEKMNNDDEIHSVDKVANEEGEESEDEIMDNSCLPLLRNKSEVTDDEKRKNEAESAIAFQMKELCMSESKASVDDGDAIRSTHETGFNDAGSDQPDSGMAEDIAEQSNTTDKADDSCVGGTDSDSMETWIETEEPRVKKGLLLLESGTATASCTKLPGGSCQSPPDSGLADSLKDISGLPVTTNTEREQFAGSNLLSDDSKPEEKSTDNASNRLDLFSHISEVQEDSVQEDASDVDRFIDNEESFSSLLSEQETTPPKSLEDLEIILYPRTDRFIAFIDCHGKQLQNATYSICGSSCQYSSSGEFELVDGEQCLPTSMPGLDLKQSYKVTIKAGTFTILEETLTTLGKGEGSILPEEDTDVKQEHKIN